MKRVINIFIVLLILIVLNVIVYRGIDCTMNIIDWLFLMILEFLVQGLLELNIEWLKKIK